MPLLYKKNKFLLFIHIPKTGGSYVEREAVKQGWKAYFIINGHRSIDMPFLAVSPQHFHANFYETIFDLSKGLAAFTIVRHPFTRLKSEYYWQVSTHVTKDSPTDWIHSSMKKLGKNKSFFDNHLRPQEDFLPRTADCRVFKFEEDGVREALKFLNLHKTMRPKIWLERILPSRRAKQSRYDFHVERDFESHRGFIETCYSDDMKRFGYDFKKQ